MFKVIEGGVFELNYECVNYFMYIFRCYLYSKLGVVEIFCVGLCWDCENIFLYGFKVIFWIDYFCE